jgi:hypothetical protein
MLLSPARLNAHFRTMGQDFLWRKGYSCPCVTAASGAANPLCTNCDGKGVTWAAGVASRCGFSSQTEKQAMKDFGQFEVGDALLSIPSDDPAYAAGRWDRFRCATSTSPFSLNLRRGFADKLRFSVVDISRVFWLDGAFNEVEGGIPAVDASTGALTWTGGIGEPAAGSWFSITGERYDEFFVYMDLPNDRNIHGLAQPRKLPCRLFDLFGR